MSTLADTILDYGRRARAAARVLARSSTAQRNAGVIAMAEALVASEADILAANVLDLARAKERGLSGAMLERLALNPKRVAAMAEGVRQVAALPDPVGEIIRRWTPPNQLEISKVSTNPARTSPATPLYSALKQAMRRFYVVARSPSVRTSRSQQLYHGVWRPRGCPQTPFS